MVTFVDESMRVSVPSWVTDLASFRRWAVSDDFPEEGRISYLEGEVWIDMSKEQIFSHVLVKTQMTGVLAGLVPAGQMGLFLGDGALLVNVTADFAHKPNAMFMSAASLDNRIRLGAFEVEGSPDMVLEVVSTSSVTKDTVTLRKAYWEAEVREYWLVDARSDALKFDVFRHTARGYSPTRKQDGWLKSAVFGKSFRLTCEVDVRGHPNYTLAVR